MITGYGGLLLRLTAEEQATLGQDGAQIIARLEALATQRHQMIASAMANIFSQHNGLLGPGGQVWLPWKLMHCDPDCEHQYGNALARGGIWNECD